MLATNHRARTAGGFTLLETVVVVVVLGILISIAAPNVSAYLSSTRVDRALNEFTADVSYTRMLAIRSGTSATLTIQPGGTAYMVQVAGSATPAKRVNLLEQYRGVSLASPTTVLTFNSRGLLTPAPENSVDIVAQTGGISAQIRVLQTGRVYRAY